MLIALTPRSLQRLALGHGRLQVVTARRHQLDRGDPSTLGQPAPSRDFSANGASGFWVAVAGTAATA